MVGSHQRGLLLQGHPGRQASRPHHFPSPDRSPTGAQEGFSPYSSRFTVPNPWRGDGEGTSADVSTRDSLVGDMSLQTLMASRHQVLC